MTSLAHEVDIHFWTAYQPVSQGGAPAKDSEFTVDEKIDGVICTVSARFTATSGQAGIQVFVTVGIKDPTCPLVSSNADWSEHEKEPEGTNKWIASKPAGSSSAWDLFAPAFEGACAKLRNQPWFIAKRERASIAAELSPAPPAAAGSKRL